MIINFKILNYKIKLSKNNNKWKYEIKKENKIISGDLSLDFDDAILFTMKKVMQIEAGL